METSDVRKRLLATVDRARRAAADRRARADEASREYSVFLEQMAVPLFRQVANSLRADGYLVLPQIAPDEWTLRVAPTAIIDHCIYVYDLQAE